MNYAIVEFCKLLYILEDHEPLGSNKWTAAYEDYRTWAVQMSLPERDVVMFKHKFDKWK